MNSKKTTITMPEEMFKESKRIINDPYSGIKTYHQLIGLGILAHKNNPQLIERIRILEEAVERLIMRMDDKGI